MIFLNLLVLFLWGLISVTIILLYLCKVKAYNMKGDFDALRVQSDPWSFSLKYLHDWVLGEDIPLNWISLQDFEKSGRNILHNLG